MRVSRRDPFHQGLKLLTSAWGDAAKYWRARTREEPAVETQHVEVNVQIERRAEALDQRDGAGIPVAASPPAFSRMQQNATSFSGWQLSHRTRRKPWCSATI